MNTYDSQVALGFLKDSGYDLISDEKQADIILINTCSVREHAEDRVYGMLHSLKRNKQKNKNLIIGVLGCMVEEHREKLFQKFPYVDLLCGTRNLKDLPKLIEDVKKKKEQIARINQEGIGVEYLETAHRESKIHAFLPIMTGCNKACTYCIVPITRGPEVSVASSEILKEANRLAGEDFKHITLLGQNVNSYGKDSMEEMSFAELLGELNKIRGIEKISFTTSHPEDATPTLFEAIRNLEKVSRRFHLPLQSGSDKILKRMKRLHTIRDYKEKIDLLRREVPDISITTDIILGFPGESEEEYLDTKKALEQIRFDGAFIFKYSERPGTPAARLKDDVPLEIKKKRNQELLDLQKGITKENNARRVGCRYKVLVEEPSMKNPEEFLGRSVQDQKVVFSASDSKKVKAGEMVMAKLISVSGDTFRGEICE